MLVLASDLGFMAAAVQSWSLPQIPNKAGPPGTAKKYLGFSIALLLLAAAASVVQELLVSGSFLGKCILIWTALELFYFLVMYPRYATVNILVEVPMDMDRIELIKERFLTLASCMPIEKFLSGWFLGAPSESVLRGNVEDFIAYGFYCRRLDQLSQQHRAEISAYVGEVEQRYGRPLKPGRNPNIQFMAHLWEPLRAIHTPLLVHIFSETAAIVSSLVLRSWGFRKLSCQGLAYWYCPGQGNRSLRIEHDGLTQPDPGPVPSPTRGGSIHTRGDSFSSLDNSPRSMMRPIMFIHGVGFGIMPYLNFLRKIYLCCPQNPMIFLDIPHVALRPLRRAKKIDDLASATKAILARHKHNNASFIGHSFGTLCISRICQLFPDIVDSMLLMDPVCCLTCYPQLLNSFIYKSTSLGEAFGSLVGLANAARTIFSRDLIIAETFCRQFLWHALMLWPEDMPHRSVVSLSVNDDLVPANLVAEHLHSTKSSAVVMTHPTAAHGGIFLDNIYQNQLVAKFKQVL